VAYNFVSPGAAAAASIEELLTRRRAEERQRMLDAMMAEDRQINRQIQAANLESLDRQRQAAEAEKQTNTAKGVVSVLAPDQPLDPETVGMLREGGFGALVAPGQEQYAGMAGDDASEPVMEQGPETFRGTAAQLKEREQRAALEEYLASLDPASPEAKALNYELRTGKSAPAGMFDRKTASTDIAEYEYYAEQAKTAGQQPMSFEEWMKAQANRKIASGSGNGGSSYFIPVQTGQGVVPFNARTGQFDDASRRDLKPSATAEGELTKAGSVLYQIGEISQMFTPERVGPLKGRYNTMQLALVGEAGDQGLAEMQSTIAGLKNTVINLRTGAQMSEPEAARILQEVPDITLPPDVFMARLNTARKYFQDWYSRRAKSAYGRNTTGDVDAMLRGEVTSAVSHTPGGTGTPAPPARKKYNPQTGRVE